MIETRITARPTGGSRRGATWLITEMRNRIPIEDMIVNRTKAAAFCFTDKCIARASEYSLYVADQNLAVRVGPEHTGPDDTCGNCGRYLYWTSKFKREYTTDEMIARRIAGLKL